MISDTLVSINKVLCEIMEKVKKYERLSRNWFDSIYGYYRIQNPEQDFTMCRTDSSLFVGTIFRE